MPLDLAELQDKCANISVEYGNHSLSVDYRPEAFDLGLSRKLRKLSESAEQEDELIAVMLKLVMGWDLTERGKPLAVNAEVLGRLPVPLLQAILQAVAEHVTGDRKNGSAPSPAG